MHSIRATSTSLKAFAGLVLLAQVVGFGSTQKSAPRSNGFQVYWNVPTAACQRFGINFESELRKWGMHVNRNDEFRGDKMVILYDPGLFPAMLKDTTTGKLVERNGGIPQLGDLRLHLDEFSNVIDKAVAKDFDGVGVIDFEAWRPVFRQNWNDQVVYKNMSIGLERQRHPQWSDKQILDEAKKNFDIASGRFMDATLKQVRALRPNARWGYYGFPYCYNYGADGKAVCPKLVKDENDGIQWLFDGSSALYPSLYVSQKLSDSNLGSYSGERMKEAVRVSRGQPIYPYIWYRYHDARKFLNQGAMTKTLEAVRKFNQGGAIIWGSSNDLKSPEECQELLEYVSTVLGPTVSRLSGRNRKG